MKKEKCGFTLIELLVVIAIVALLLSIIMPALKSKDPEAKRRALDNLLQLVNLSRELKDVLLKNRVKEYFLKSNQPVPF